MEVLSRLQKFIYSSSCVENKTLLFFNSWCLNTHKTLCVYADCLSQYLANSNCCSLKTNFFFPWTSVLLFACDRYRTVYLQRKVWSDGRPRSPGRSFFAVLGVRRGPFPWCLTRSCVCVRSMGQGQNGSQRGTRGRFGMDEQGCETHLRGLWTADHGLTGSNCIELSSLSSQENIPEKYACLASLCNLIFLPPSPYLLVTLMGGCPWKPRVGMKGDGVTVVVQLETNVL